MYTTSLLLACAIFHLSNAVWTKYMENPSLYEGDMELNSEQTLKLYSGYAVTKKGGFYLHWPIGKPIPYYIDPALIARRSSHKEALLRAMKDYERYTCLRFIPRTNEKNYIHFVTGGGCSSMVGMMHSTPNFIRLHDNCFWSHGTLLHEIAHTLGIFHEQSRPDRDQFVKIHPENMKCCASQFKKRDFRTIDSLNEPYDYDSMMHYGATAFGNGNGVTIEVLKKGRRIGQRNGFSPIDLRQINKMYKCGGHGSVTTSRPSVTTGAATNPPPSSGVYLVHTSGSCLKLASGLLTFSKSCSTKFQLTSDKRLRLVQSNKCAYPESKISDAKILFSDSCKDSFEKVEISGNYFALKHVESGKCIHPKKGSPNPKDGTLAVIYHSCGGNRLKFKEA